MHKILNYIGGTYQEPTSRTYFDNYEPATGLVYSKIADSDSADVAQAVQAAEAAFPIWSHMSTQERSRILLKLSELIDQNLEELAALESRDNGKPLKLARSVDIPRARDNFAFFSTAILHDESQMHDMGSKGFNYTKRQPLGVVGCISPWNLPLYLFSWKIAPALASGNCVVAKPSEVTPFTAYKLGELATQAGMPPGVLNIVQGTGPKVGAAIVEHPKIVAISFTGGTATGKAIAATAAPMFKKLSLELGGKNPNIIFADCDYEKTLKTSVLSSFSNQGQICLCGSRIFIEQSIYDKFKEDFVARVKNLKVGSPTDPEVQIGALVSKPHIDKVLSYIQLAQEEGGIVLAGGHIVSMPAPYEKGYYLAPTVIENLAHDCRTNQEEIFGPVVTLTPFTTEEEVIMMANSTPYGLAATVHTNNLYKAHKTADALHSGIVWINTWLMRDLRTPFGGMKASGVGREGGFEALHFFTEAKNVCVAY